MKFSSPNLGFMLGIMFFLSIIILTISEYIKLPFADPLNEMGFIAICLLGLSYCILALIEKK